MTQGARPRKTVCSNKLEKPGTADASAVQARLVAALSPRVVRLRGKSSRPEQLFDNKPAGPDARPGG